MATIIPGNDPEKLGRNTFRHSYVPGTERASPQTSRNAAELLACIIAKNMIKLEAFTGRPIKNIDIKFDNESKDILERLPAEITVRLYDDDEL